MAGGIYVALSGAVAQSRALDVASENVANAGTTGFRAERLSFGQTLAGARARSKDQSYVDASTALDPTPGPLVTTGNPLDVAVTGSGDGYFSVDSARGVRYTRAGDFRVGADGRLVNAAGLAVRSRDGNPLVVPAGVAAISVGSDGSVVADGRSIGVLAVTRFRARDLQQEGAGLLVARGAPLATPAGAAPPAVTSGALESGNFNVVRGVVDLVRISRTYEALHRMIESYKEIDQRTARAANGSG